VLRPPVYTHRGLIYPEGPEHGSRIPNHRPAWAGVLLGENALNQELAMRLIALSNCGFEDSLRT